ncbi:hypothetical protein AVEN_209067-1 [Araneus ventricosus]|uniref:Uncharacterized protein n=1 Tax=Araneus ventricosus TaxID=182803 RepID=A0A4Y2UAY5_ARAVE|nr:hypothetical protein AVEN_209067-1 [Araneus ventricosus]
MKRVIDSVTERRQREAEKRQRNAEKRQRKPRKGCNEKPRNGNEKPKKMKQNLKLKSKLALLEKQLEIERIKNHSREIKNCVPRSYPNLELELRGTSGNSSDPLSIPDISEEEEMISKGHRQRESDRSNREGLVHFTGFPNINEILSCVPVIRGHTTQGNQGIVHKGTVDNKCGNYHSSVSDTQVAGKSNPVAKDVRLTGVERSSENQTKNWLSESGTIMDEATRSTADD